MIGAPAWRWDGKAADESVRVCTFQNVYGAIQGLSKTGGGTFRYAPSER
jgi:hypothetical protein